jgi:hypothetical protein
MSPRGAVPIETGENMTASERTCRLEKIAERMVEHLKQHAGVHDPGECHGCDLLRDLVFVTCEVGRLYKLEYDRMAPEQGDGR